MRRNQNIATEGHHPGCNCVDCNPDFHVTEVRKEEVGGDRGIFIRNAKIVGKPSSEYPRSSLITG